MRHVSGRTQLVRYGLLVALSALGSQAHAQTTGATTTDTGGANEDDVVVLSDFEVSTEQDIGYRATNSIGATRSNTPIKDVPLNIQVFTKDLYQDLNIVSQEALSGYNASMINGGADVHSDNPIQQDYNHFLFRGFRQNWGLRDGIREYDPIDTQALSRVEVIKGPAAALYGLTYPGGVVQNISKAPDYNRAFGGLRFRIGGEGDYRASFDGNMNSEIGDQRIAARVNGVYAETKDQRAHSDGSVNFFAANIGWKPARSTTFELLIERGYREKPNGLGTQSNGNDGRAYFARNEFTDTTGGEAGSFGLIPLQISNPNISWNWNWSDGKNMRSLDTELYRGTATHRFSDNFQVQGYVQYSTRWAEDAHGWGANGDGGAASWEAGGGWVPSASTTGGVPAYVQQTAGGPWVVSNTGVGGVIRSSYTYRDWTNKMHSYGATGVYKVEFGPTKHTFTFGGAAWSENFISRSKKELDPTFLELPVQQGINTQTPFAPPDDLVDVTSGDNNWAHENSANDYYFANWQMSAFDDRLTTNIGVNRTNINLLRWDSGVDNTPNETDQSQTSPLIGAVFDVTDSISVFAVHSTSLFPDTGKDSFGNQFSPIEGESIEAGLKFETKDGRFGGTLSYYTITQTGGSQNNPNKINAQGQLGDLDVGGEQESKGFELDFVYSPLRNWQIMFSYAHNSNEITESFTPVTIGQSTPQSADDRYALVTKYTFVNGGAEGLYLGLGVYGSSDVLIDYKPDASGELVARYSPARWPVNLFAGYPWKVGDYTLSVQFNADNITEEDDYTGWVATGSPTVLATKRYKVPTAARYSLTFGLDF